jgi:tetratricopeptide (TPR) repeat protein
MDKIIEYILKRNKPVGIILLAIAVLIFLNEALNTLAQIGQITSNSIWFPLAIIIVLLFGLVVGQDKQGNYPPRTRQLARFLVLVCLQMIILLGWSIVKVNLPIDENTFRWIYSIFALTCLMSFPVVDKFLQKPKNFIILFFEFSEAANEEIPKDRHITHTVRKGLRKRFEGTKVLIQELDEVIIDDKKAIARGKNAGAIAVIYGIYTKTPSNIILDLGWEVIRKPEYFQPIDIGRKVLAMEEFDTGRLEILIENDYANVTNFLVGLFEYSSEDFESTINTFASLTREANAGAGLNSLKAEILYLYLGNSYYSLRDIDNSKSSFEQALSINQNNPKVIHNVGVIEYQSGNFNKAIDRFTEALALDNQLIVGYRNRAFVLIKHNADYQKALEDLLKCLQLKPFDTDALKFSAICHRNLGNHSEAIKYFKLAHRTKRRDLDIVFDLANEYIETKSYLKAFTLPLSQLFRGKHYSRILGYLGDTSRKLGHRTVAEVFYTIALVFDKKKHSLYYSRSKARYDSGKYSLAKKDLEKVIQKEPQMSQAYLDLGDIYMRQKNYAQAEAYYSKGIALSPNSPTFYLSRAQAFFALEKYDEVIEDCRNYIKLKKSESLKICLLLAYSYSKLSKYDKAIYYADKARQLSPTEQNKISLANVYLAHVKFLIDLNGKSDEILRHYETAQSLNPLIKLDEKYELKIMAISKHQS